MSECILALDVGGTFIKYALLLKTGVLVEDTVGQAPAGSTLQTADALAAFRGVVHTAARLAQRRSLRIARVSVAFPGPFDYDRGIPLMQHKFQSLYGVFLTPAVHSVLPGVPVVYLHDSTAFLLGEAVYGAARGVHNPAGIMLGTGLGFACMQDGRVCVLADQRPTVRVWNRPFRGGIVEDVLSARGIGARFRARAGEERSAKEIAHLADAGHVEALAVYRETGALIAEILGPLLEQLGCGMLVVGGQAARSARLFLPYAKLRIPVVPAADLDAAALKGACAYALLGRERTVHIMEGNVCKGQTAGG